jgi:hypothetical protein
VGHRLLANVDEELSCSPCAGVTYGILRLTALAIFGAYSSA